MKVLRKIVNMESMLYQECSHDIFEKHDHFFQLDDRWEYVDDIEQADIVPILPAGKPKLDRCTIKLRDDQMLCMLLYYVIDDHYDITYFENILEYASHIAKNVLIVHKNSNYRNHEHKNIVHYDAMFDIAKMCFTEYQKYDFNNRVWNLYSHEDTYRLQKIEKNIIKKFMFPTYVYPPYTHARMIYRKKVRDIIEPYKENGYVSTDKVKLMPNEPVSDLMLNNMLNSTTIQWYPVSDELYNSSCISIVCETITGKLNDDNKFNQVKCVTEKTLEPLAKGNFILPFGYPGLIQDILAYGFKLPDWIDYSYDDLQDVDKRFAKFETILNKLLANTSMYRLQKLCDRDMYILEHNKRVFYTRPYDNLYDRILSKYKELLPR